MRALNVWWRRQEYPIDDTVHRGVGSHAERDRQSNTDSKPIRPASVPKRKAEILTQARQHGRELDPASGTIARAREILAVKTDVTETLFGGASRLVSRQAALYEEVRHHIEMKLNLLVHISASRSIAGRGFAAHRVVIARHRSPRLGGEDSRHGGGVSVPGVLVLLQLAPTFGRQGVELGPSLRLGHPPRPAQEAALLEAVQGRVERAVVDLEFVPCLVGDPADHAVPVAGVGSHGFEDQEIQGAADEVEVFTTGHGLLAVESSDIDSSVSDTSDSKVMFRGGQPVEPSAGSGS